MPTLFDPVTLGSIHAPNRILMSPLTRTRGTAAHVPTPIMATYYTQRATAGLIISEATGISQQGLGTPFAPGLWSDEQVEAWKPIVQAVHDAGGRIIAQLWHMGRLVHSDFNNGETPVSASATRHDAHTHTYQGKKAYETARALRLDEIPGILDDYSRAAENAKKAGFDGVQLHAANGYLIDQFIRSGTNFRTDEYGGAIENRIRLLGEATERLIAVWGKENVSVRLSPNGDSQGVDDATPNETFVAAAKLLDGLGIAFLELREIPAVGSFGQTDVPPVSPLIRPVFRNPLVLNSDYTYESATAALAEGKADAISFGRPYISNPDLVERFRTGAPLAPSNVKTWYAPVPEGYVDYPTLAEESIAAE